MFLSRISIVFIACCSLAGVLAAQTTSSGAQPANSQSGMNALGLGRDPQAVAIVERAINALGGATAIGQAQSWRVKAQMQLVSNSAALPHGSTDSASGAETTMLEWEVAGSEVRTTGKSGSRSWEMVTGHGKPAAISGGITKQLNTRSVHSIIVPFLADSMLLEEMQNANVSITSAGRRSWNGTLANIIKTRSSGFGSAAGRQTWYFDEQSGLPVRLEYERVGEGSASPLSRGAFEFSQYSAIDNILYPSEAAVYLGRTLAGNLRLQSVEPNIAVQAADFDPPTGGGQ